MRLYRFTDKDKNIDVVVVTDGSCKQKRIVITESPRGIVPEGSVNISADEKAGSDAFLALGWNWNVGEVVQHEELVAFAENNGLTLAIHTEGLNEIVSVNAEWNDNDDCVLNINTALPEKMEAEIHFPNSVTLDDSVGRYGIIRGDKKGLITILQERRPLTFSLTDLGLAAKEDLNIVVTAEDGIQKFEVTAKMN